MARQICKSFPSLFDEPDEEGDNGQGDGKADTASDGRGGKEHGFGILPYVLTYCRVAYTPIQDALRESVVFVFNVVSCEVHRLHDEQEALKRFKKSH